MNTLNKQSLANIVSEKHNLTKKQALEIVDLIFDSILDTLAEEGIVDIHGFGKFEVKLRPAHLGVNPQTRERIQIPDSNIPSFKPSKALKEKVK